MADQPEELRRKLALLEGDRKAYYESSQATIQSNKELINRLRKENKVMTARIKELKGPAGSSGKDTGRLDAKVKEQIKKHNALRHDATAKVQAIADLEKKIKEVEIETGASQKGESPEAQQLRTLENRLDKAQIKYQEAMHIGNTYRMIITKLEQDRLTYDGQIQDLERAIAARKQEVADLEAMYNDSVLARDNARKQLAVKEKAHLEEKKAREEEKRELDRIAEERRRQYEALEKRLRMTVKTSVDHGSGAREDSLKQQVETLEGAMNRIKEATGVTNVQEVVERFEAQRETRDHLQALSEENRVRLAELKEEHERLTKQYDALKYSGDARNSSNNRMVEEFQQHLSQVKARCDDALEGESKTSMLLVRVVAGIDHLMDKVNNLDAKEDESPATTEAKLREVELRLCALNEELEAKRDSLPSDLLEAPPVVTLPEHNTRIFIQNDHDGSGQEDSDSEDEDFVSRDVLKRQAQSLIDATTKKKKGGRKK
eukprot:m.293106 g.293106  ORF g.293106 m.293106 type:complete len:489 (-) comp12729_c0_seq1:2490-3956(-)